MRDDFVPGVTDLEPIASSGRASVYRGVETATGRTVAVKVLTTELDDPVRRAQFENDCQAIQALSAHPHVARMYGSGITAGGQPYVVMEYLPRSVAHLIAEQGRLRWQEIVALGVETASALAAGHKRGVLHRDVTPSNILLASDDVPRLTDFGLAASVAAPDSPTGSITTRLSHAAPEVVQGKPGDERSDVYSLASTLHEALTGAPPFVRPGDENLVPVVSRLLGEPPPSLQRFGVPGEIEQVLLGAMAKDPAARPATAEQFARQLLAAARSVGEHTMELRITQRAAASGAWAAAPAAAEAVAGGPARRTPRGAAGAGPNGPAGPMAPAGGERPRGPADFAARRRGVAIAAVALVALTVVGVVMAAKGGDDDGDQSASSTSFTAVGEETTLADSTVPDTTAAPARTTSPRSTSTAPSTPTSTTLGGEGFHFVTFESDAVDGTFTMPADGKFHDFNFTFTTTGGTKDTLCPVRSDVEKIDGPGISDIEIGECTTTAEGKGQFQLKAFNSTTAKFTIWVCDGERLGPVCSDKKRSTNGIDITVVATK